MSQVDDCEYVARHDNNMRSIALSGIESNADHMIYYADSLRRYLRVLEDMPIYETRAEDAVARAEAALKETLEAVRVAKEQIAKFR